jgi:hypothetical protein
MIASKIVKSKHPQRWWWPDGGVIVSKAMLKNDADEEAEIAAQEEAERIEEEEKERAEKVCSRIKAICQTSTKFHSISIQYSLESI